MLLPEKTIVKHIHPGDLILDPDVVEEQCLLVLAVDFATYGSYLLADITFLYPNNKIKRSEGWISLYKLT